MPDRNGEHASRLLQRLDAVPDNRPAELGPMPMPEGAPINMPHMPTVLPRGVTDPATAAPQVPDTRSTGRKVMEGVGAFAAESALPVAGTVAGGAFGALLGNAPGAMIGGAAGGAGGEWLNQKLGITPDSDAAIGLSAAGPALGVAAGGAAKLARRGVGGTMGLMTPARKALGTTLGQKASQEMDDIAQALITAAPKRIPPRTAGAIETLESQIARFQKAVPGSDVPALDVPGFRNWLINVSNPKHKAYDPNFVRVMQPYMKGLKENLKKLHVEVEQAGSGAAQLQTSGRAAGAGAFMGSMLAGPVGGFVGGLAGANWPRQMTATLMSERGSAALEKALKLGKGKISGTRWATIGQMIGQGGMHATRDGEPEEHSLGGP